jgi:acetyl-CoA acetyltransferase
VVADAFICGGLRTPIGRFGGVLAAGIRADDLAAIPLAALRERHPGADWGALDDVVPGCANQAGEDNRSVARMAVLLAGFGDTVSGTTINRLCSHSMPETAENIAQEWQISRTDQDAFANTGLRVRRHA